MIGPRVREILQEHKPVVGNRNAKEKGKVVMQMGEMKMRKGTSKEKHRNKEKNNAGKKKEKRKWEGRKEERGGIHKKQI